LFEHGPTNCGTNVSRVDFKRVFSLMVWGRRR
jgi:hypothetical protein